MNGTNKKMSGRTIYNMGIRDKHGEEGKIVDVVCFWRLDLSEGDVADMVIDKDASTIPFSDVAAVTLWVQTQTPRPV